jgi:hypothetical protein
MAGEIRTSGDKRLASILAASLQHHGRVERMTHGFHSYPAGMHPEMARIMVEAFEGPVHDPFCGGGTVLVEGILAGRQTTGTDLSPIALLVAHARTSGPEYATPMRSAARKISDKAKLRIDVEVHEELASWYEPHVAQEMGRLRDGILEAPEEVQLLLSALLSSITVKASLRESDTSNRRKPQHRPPGTTAILFHKKARELGRALDQMPATRDCIIELADARTTPAPDGVGLILTSPPYPGVYDYLPMQQLRLGWLEIDATEGFSGELGSRRSFRAKGRQDALAAWRKDTQAWIGTQASALAVGGVMGIVVGDGLVGDRPVDTLSPTIECMRAAGLEIVARASADRPDHAREVIRTEHLVLGERVS